jgi:branched-chain amino acid transport system ATP-binding protein
MPFSLGLLLEKAVFMITESSDMGPKIKTLKIDNISLSFGGLLALKEISIMVDCNEIVAIIGPNGAGKTSLINCINGFYRPQRGNIYYGDRKITFMASHKIAELGIARTFQNIELYQESTTLDNIMSARHSHIKYNVMKSAIFFGPARREEVKQRRYVENIIEFLEMGAIRKKPVCSLPYGLRKRIELGRALALEPSLLLLDEPMAGMNSEEKENLAKYILSIHLTRRIPILLIEHDMGFVMDIADRIIVLDFGEKIAEGSPEEIKENPAVIKAYLGDEM